MLLVVGMISGYQVDAGGEDSADVKDVDDVPLVTIIVGGGVDSGRVDSEPPPRPKLQMKGW